MSFEAFLEHHNSETALIHAKIMPNLVCLDGKLQGYQISAYSHSYLWNYGPPKMQKSSFKLATCRFH